MVRERSPAEHFLRDIFGVNRSTVRQTISEPFAKGVIPKKTGVGSSTGGKDLLLEIRIF